MVGIYKIINKINNKIYVGQSIDILDRFYQHKYKATHKEERGYPQPIHQAFRKYGIENFDFEVIEECDYTKLDERERFWIKELDCITPKGYNILEGGQKIKTEPRLCIKCGTTISKGNKTHLCINCYKQKLREHIPQKEELIIQLKNANGNFEQVARYYNRRSSAIRKWCDRYNISHHSQDYKSIKPNTLKKSNKIPVYQIDKNTGEVIQEFESAMDAARTLGKSKGSHITEVCKGTHKTAYGYIWKYKN